MSKLTPVEWLQQEAVQQATLSAGATNAMSQGIYRDRSRKFSEAASALEGAAKLNEVYASLLADLEAEVERLRKSAPPEDEWCNCIMVAHCSKSKRGRCRGAAFGTSGEGSPGVASPPTHPAILQADRLQALVDKHKEGQR